jgi:hypothetical protein
VDRYLADLLVARDAALDATLAASAAADLPSHDGLTASEQAA